MEILWKVADTTSAATALTSTTSPSLSKLLPLYAGTPWRLRSVNYTQCTWTGGFCLDPYIMLYYVL
jgi:hypothetical protein